ncbi:MAG: ATP-binding cassette domain-containing protein [Flavobacteriales bacterium]|nr:ATP-binding cassette domain-containing protein [Flavobacteriales bacterium]
MSERILKALMQLFAIVAGGNDDGHSLNNARKIVRQFLAYMLSKGLVGEYLTLFDEFHEKHYGGSGSKRKRTSVNSVKVLKICSQINEELTQRQKVIVLIWLLEYIYLDREPNEQELDFVNTVADSFNLSQEEYREIRSFVSAKDISEQQTANLCTISATIGGDRVQTKQIHSEGLQGHIAILSIKSINEYVFRYFGSESITLNGQIVSPGRSSILSQGSTIRSSKILPIYYSDIVGVFLDELNTSKINFVAQDISYTFPNGNIGLHNLNIVEESGRMVGIMGGSGSGKSTLLNVLNGNYTPSTGKVTLNGHDIHRNSGEVEGQIGYVAQDDLLIEELTVFQNLYYTARLCFASLSEEELVAKVDQSLIDLGLHDKKDLKVGNPLEKTISGGQRKRLNIALELIREPTVLFVDEPTSGLSSRDSENIMDLLKELTLKGKLVFVVIHQPSSDIFKMFDKIFFLDYGGYTAFYGNPIDSIIYFKREASYANSDDGDCFSCGNVNPELVFNILEAKVVDEYGNQTATRKVSPEDWYAIYNEKHTFKRMDLEGESELPGTAFKIPNLWNQFKVFITRDVLAKFTNRQYMLINILEAPALAALLAFFLKYYIQSDGLNESPGYVFRLNENVPQFIFISVIVALFIGLTVSSEEIIRDKRIRAREAFLNLSRGSYISSKISVMIILSAIQMFLYVIVGAFILEIKGLALMYWVGLFSTCAFANLLGLNISANFNSAKVIYILIPVMIIPQLLFSGVIVSFDKLHPTFASQKAVPWIGNIMTSRWAYEGIAVSQFKDNAYQSEFYALDQRRLFSNWKKDSWVNALENKVSAIRRNLESGENPEKLKYDLDLVYTEIKEESSFIKDLEFPYLHRLTPEECNSAVLDEVDDYLTKLTKHYRIVFNQADKEKEKIIEAMNGDLDSDDSYLNLYNGYSNESLEKFVTNKNGLRAIDEYQGVLIQKKDLIYTIPKKEDSLFDAAFYSPKKKMYNNVVDTFWANMAVIWAMTIFLAFTLYTDLFKAIKNAGSRFWYSR